MKFTFVHPQVKEELHDDADDEASWQHVYLWCLDLILTVVCRIITCHHVCMCAWDVYCCRTGLWKMPHRPPMASWSVYSSLRCNIVAHTTSLSGNGASPADDEEKEEPHDDEKGDETKDDEAEKDDAAEKDDEEEEDDEDENDAGRYDAWLNPRFCPIRATAVNHDQ